MVNSLEVQKITLNINLHNTFFFRFNPENFPKISKERFGELQGAFTLLDKDELGFINTRDLKNALRFLGQKR